jgi:hypothetical protein
MGFRLKHLLRLLPIVLLAGSIAVASSKDGIPVGITVLVNDSAGVPPATLSQAEREAARIFRDAGIEIAWVNCQDKTGNTDRLCRDVLGVSQFVLHIVQKGRTSTDNVFGVAFLGEDGSGKYCNVFFDRIREAPYLGANTSRLLGTVAAHELGHLLLGSHAHSLWGIMQPVWKEEALREAGMGRFLFTTEQADLMKARIERRAPAMVGVGGKKQWAVVRGQ